jgi:hypothetical protein
MILKCSGNLIIRRGKQNYFNLILVVTFLACSTFSNSCKSGNIKNTEIEIVHAVQGIESFGNKIFAHMSEGNVADLISLLPKKEDYVSMYQKSTLPEDDKGDFILIISDLVNSEQIEFVNNFSTLQKELKKHEINLEEKKITSINYTLQNISQIIQLRLDLIFDNGDDVFWIKLSDCKFIDGKWYLGKNVNLIRENKASENKDADKFIITNKSVGFFRLGDAWQEVAKNEYKFEFIQGYGTCADAFCDGGYDLGTNLKINKYGFVVNPLITLGAEPFDKYSDSPTKHQMNTKVFFVESDNNSAWYYKDKAKYLVIYSDLFKTKEGIGVGSSLQKAQEKLGKIKFEVGWLREEEFPMIIKVSSYPNIAFVVNPIDYMGDLEKIDLSGEDNLIRVSDFKGNAKIIAIIVGDIY